MKVRSINMLIAALLLLGALAVVLIVFIQNTHDEFEENITVSEEGVTESVLSVKHLRLIPTESKEYTINLVCAATGSYHVSLLYEEVTDGGMKPFVEVSVDCDGEIVYEGTLSELFDEGFDVQFETELKEKDPTKILIRYEMPRHIGNEAQETYTEFKLHLEIEKS